MAGIIRLQMIIKTTFENTFLFFFFDFLYIFGNVLIKVFVI